MALASPPPAANQGAVGTMTSGVITRQFAGPQTYLAPMPTAVVLLRRDQETRNARFCSEYVKQDGLADMGAEGGLAANMLLTRWLLAAPDLESTPTDCDRMLRNYDFTRSAALIQQFAKEEGGTLGAVGPHILVIYPDGGAILLDGSNVPTNELRQWSTGWVQAMRPPTAAVAAAAAPAAAQAASAAAANPATVRQENISSWERMRRTAYATLRGMGTYGEVIMGALSWAFAPVPPANG